jgi:hypothetical protein
MRLCMRPSVRLCVRLLVCLLVRVLLLWRELLLLLRLLLLQQLLLHLPLLLLLQLPRRRRAAVHVRRHGHADCRALRLLWLVRRLRLRRPVRRLRRLGHRLGHRRRSPRYAHADGRTGEDARRHLVSRAILLGALPNTGCTY